MKLAPDGLSLKNYVAGQPFPNLDPKDPQMAIKIMWNYEYKFNPTDDEERRFWNEQQLLQAFLIGNSDFEVLFANAYASRKFPDQMKAAFPTSPWWGGGSFWMRRQLRQQ